MDQYIVPSTRAWLEHRYLELSTVELELWLVALSALTLDVILTYVGLQSGFSEGNPIMGYAFEHVGFAVLGLVKVVVLGTAGLARELRPEYGPVIPLGLALPWLAASVVNYTLLF
ncbi:DUF5658 family protein [Halomicrobium sp. LC1Hm]|uniref:DUF5658 family protein n=1 Tax=Halomicrobium sp. LC1Hm TaxID=2610902 RepID=UPI0012983813|nr:DUF5658 family protein [Halomicrobium sp. LC1Hm]